MLSGPGKRPPAPRSGASGLSSGSLLFLPKRRVIIAQPLPADQALQPGRGAWGGNVDWPEISPASRQAGSSSRAVGGQAGVAPFTRATQRPPPQGIGGALPAGPRLCWTTPAGAAVEPGPHHPSQSWEGAR